MQKLHTYGFHPRTVRTNSGTVLDPVGARIDRKGFPINEMHSSRVEHSPKI